MRDVGKVKDRFELKLDSNRVFFLFAGLVAYSALIFVLGVVVGRSARPETGGEIASAPVRLPGEQPTPKHVEDRLADAQPDATEEPEIPLKAIWELDKPGNAQSLGSITPVKTATPVPHHAAVTPKATPAETPVKVAAASPVATSGGAGEGPSEAKGAFTLQVIAYNELAQAETLEARLKARGFDAYTRTADIPGKGTVHRVRVGRYVSRALAERAAEQLAAVQPDIKPLIVVFE